jgi:hypothetical protein
VERSIKGTIGLINAALCGCEKFPLPPAIEMMTFVSAFVVTCCAIIIIAARLQNYAIA